MYVTNLTKTKLGINGALNLAPQEVNRYIDNENLDLVKRVARLEAANLVSVVREEGLTKTGIPGKIVKAVGADLGAVTSAPRSENVPEPKEEEVVEVKETVKKASTRRTKKAATVETTEEVAVENN